MIETGSIDLVVLDFEMPDMDGAEICRQLRAHAVPTIADLPKEKQALYNYQRKSQVYRKEL